MVKDVDNAHDVDNVDYVDNVDNVIVIIFLHMKVLCN